MKTIKSMVNAAFCIKIENKKNHVNLINDFIIKNGFLDKHINEYFDKLNNQTYYLISDSIFDKNELIDELNFILDKEEYKWFGHL